MPEGLEQELVADLAAQTVRYEAAREVAQRVAESLQRREEIAADMDLLGRLMREVAASAADAATRQQQWRQQGRPAGEALRAAVAHHMRVLERLIQLVHDAEQAAEHARDQLSPQLDAVARDRRVVESYGQAARL